VAYFSIDGEKKSKVTRQTKQHNNDNKSKEENEFGLFKPLCKDNNGTVKLDIDGKRQLINTKPCQGKVQESLKDSVLLLY